MSKKTTFTSITALPADMTREVVLDFLHNHQEMIDLNPLVIERHMIEPPPHAEPDESVCTWYSITDKITFMPGVKGDITYTAAFWDLPNGIQTHVYAPMGTDIRERWTLNGTLPGEPLEPVELGIGAPAQGLYIREDVELRCNVLMAGFTRKTLKKAHEKVVEAIGEKARLQKKNSSESRIQQCPCQSHPDPQSITQAQLDLGGLPSPAPPPPPPKDECYLPGYINHRPAASDSNLIPNALHLERIRGARMSAQSTSNSRPGTGLSNSHSHEPARTSSAPQIPPFALLGAGTSSEESQGRYRPLTYSRQPSYEGQTGGWSFDKTVYDVYTPPEVQNNEAGVPQQVAELQ